MRAHYIELRRLMLLHERIKKNYLVDINHEFIKIKRDLKAIIKNRKLRKRGLRHKFFFWIFFLNRCGFWKTLKTFCYGETSNIKMCINDYWDYKGILMKHDEIRDTLYFLEEFMKSDIKKEK